jgi:ATP-dependent DNA helicase RecG
MLPTPPFGEARGTPWGDIPPPHSPGPDAWNTPLGTLKGVGRVTAENAAGMGLVTIGDVLQHLPMRYLSYEQARPVASLTDGQEATIRVRLTSIRVRPTRQRRLKMVEAHVRDQSGSITAIWFNQAYLVTTLQPGDELLLRGKVDRRRGLQMTVKSHEVIGGATSEGLHTEGLVPVYPATEALSARKLREMVDAARPFASAAVERLPAWMRIRLSQPTAADALVACHFPRSSKEATNGRRRLALEELIVLQLGLEAVRRAHARRLRATKLDGPGDLSGRLLDSLPFTLTAEQVRVWSEIRRDIARPAPMRRLLQGEVGAGKTVIAALAACQAAERDAQCAILVPTETLAEQHLKTLDRMLGPVGIAPILLTGKVPRAERERRLMALSTGTAPLVVGTQALLSEGVIFARLGLVVVDEQHRFGVEQRQALVEQTSREDDGWAAHLLYMTATPIPRTLALTAYGDLRVSTIRGRPPGRQPVETRWVREDAREGAYDDLRAELRRGRQAYVICPLVEEEGALVEARAAVAEAERLARGPLAGFTVGLAHGAQKSDEKRAAMAAFASGQSDVLVATTVVEVGIDVPNATVMVIEDADRFGLAQLHQLRGRVGRGEHPGLCLLFADPSTDDAIRRLEAITQTQDGFRLAELDLEIRGEGQVMGLRQAGPTDLRFAKLSRNRRELAQARQVARRVLSDDPTLAQPEHLLLRQAVEARFGDLPRLLEG